MRSLAASFNAMLARLSAFASQRERALEATRRFAFDAGHELRTPLTPGQATLSALHRHPDVSPEQRGRATRRRRSRSTLPDAPVVLRGWEPGLRLLVANLVTNAAHHGRPGGHVRVTLVGRRPC